MMTRNPVNRNIESGAPYPTSPTSSIENNTESPFPPRIPPHDIFPNSRTEANKASVDSSSSADHNGSNYPNERRANGLAINKDLPPVLRIGAGKASTKTWEEDVKTAKRQAESVLVTPRSSWEESRPTTPETTGPVSSSSQNTHVGTTESLSNNPYRRKLSSIGKAPDISGYGGESAEVWGDTNSAKPPPISKFEPLQSDTRQIREPFTEPWMRFEPPPSQQTLLGSESDLFPVIPTPTAEAATEQFQSSEASSGTGPGKQIRHKERLPTNNKLRDTEAPELARSPGDHQDDHLSLKESPSFKSYTDGMPNSHDLGQTLGSPRLDDDRGPTLPPRPPVEQPGQPPPQPPRPAQASNIEENKNANPASDDSVQSRPSGKPVGAEETYQIRLVNWYDASSTTNPRRSPVMVQNANGPCPLLALVNALVLSTPSDITTGLVDTLRIREQISLDFLLRAIIDELMTGRRRGVEETLPDISNLYTFLVGLHSGMNVNPRFVPFEETAPSLLDAPIEDGMPSNLHQHRRPGGFEQTREMELYSTFAIPLIHGWIPPRNHPAFTALKRTAKTYEDAQNLMFREEELEEKLRRQGLSPEEQLILEDIASVKYFLSSTATQLTGYGLDTITETLAPGTFAILFRNDHFSTLYRHPRSGQLLTLVSDMGYAGHDEVVWESLVDVSGEGSEFYSGDFRPVGNVVNASQQESTDKDSGWTTVKSQRPPRPTESKPTPDLPPLSTLNINEDHHMTSPITEQDDHDLALAMQLQEEEEERDRQEAAARRREDELSQAYLNSSDAQGRRTFPGFARGAAGAREGPSIPARGRGKGRGNAQQTTSNPTNSTPPRHSAVPDEDAPPPSYEQAAQGPPYVPPANHAPHPSGSTGRGGTTARPPPGRPRQSSAYSEQAAAYATSPVSAPPRRGHMPRNSASGSMGRGGMDPGLRRRRTNEVQGSAVSLDSDRRDKDCVVM